MSVPQTRPCGPWPVEDWSCELPTGLPQAQIDACVMAATHVLWALSGRRYGFCETTVRPDATGCSVGTPRYLPYELTPWGWTWVPQQWCCDPYGTAQPSVIKLWHYPVTAVLGVSIDGTLVPPSAYRIDEWRWLRRVDGADWPIGQDWTQELGAPGTWSITYRWGAEVPQLGQLAAGVLACELAKSMSGLPCQLPERVQSVSRQGVSMTFIDPSSVLVGGRTGLYLVDLFLETVNPGRLRNRARVFRADERFDARGVRPAKRLASTELPPVVPPTEQESATGAVMEWDADDPLDQLVVVDGGAYAGWPPAPWSAAITVAGAPVPLDVEGSLEGPDLQLRFTAAAGLVAPGTYAWSAWTPVGHRLAGSAVVRSPALV